MSTKGPIGEKCGNNGIRRSTTWRSTKPVLFPSALMLMWPLRALSLTLTMQQPEKRLRPLRPGMPADGKQKKAQRLPPDVRDDGDVSVWEIRDETALSGPDGLRMALLMLGLMARPCLGRCGLMTLASCGSSHGRQYMR